jgi:hypothetical protein
LKTKANLVDLVRLRRWSVERGKRGRKGIPIGYCRIKLTTLEGLLNRQPHRH